MSIEYHGRFLKHFKKRIQPNSTLVKRFRERLNLFMEDRFNPILQDHSLEGSKSTFHAFSITGDIRVIYKIKEDDEVIQLIDIGTHNQVY